MDVIERPDEAFISTPTYTLGWRRDRPGWLRFSLPDAPPLELWVAATADTTAARDVARAVWPPTLRSTPPTLVVRGRGGVWERRCYVVRCWPDHLELWQEVEGRGSLDRVAWLAGRTPEGGAQGSQHQAPLLFTPEPHADARQLLPAGAEARVDVGSDPTFHRGHWFFTPAPYCFALGPLGRGWLGLGLAVRPGEHTFTSFRREAVPDLALVAEYEGHTEVRGAWESPHLLLFPSRGPYEALTWYCDTLRRRKLAPGTDGRRAAWWLEPLFCGWGEQFALAGREMASREAEASAPPDVASLARAAASQATQANYERFLAALDRHGLDPGTVVVDDGWQTSYGSNDVHRGRWPDLPGFIAAQHARGRRVLLWLKAWDPTGVPAEACVVDSERGPVAVDPASPAYQALLRDQVRRLLREYGADGFKIDFTHRAPRGRHLRHAGPWGVELLRTLLAVVHDAAAEVRPDALIVAHAANPYFHDVVNVLRLNDVPIVPGQERFVDAMRHRARVARAAGPGWAIDTDNWPAPSKAAWRAYLEEQPLLGVPALYYATRIFWRHDDGRVVDEPLAEDDYAAVRRVWQRYRAERLETTA